MKSLHGGIKSYQYISNKYIWDGLKACLPCPTQHLQWVSCVFGVGAADGPFVWAEKPQTQQRPPVQRPTHGTMGWAQGGGLNSWAEAVHLHTLRLANPCLPHPHKQPPTIQFTHSCRCLPVCGTKRKLKTVQWRHLDFYSWRRAVTEPALQAVHSTCSTLQSQKKMTKF